MEDFYVLNAGYQAAIKDVLEKLCDLKDIDIITDRLLRMGEKYRAINEEKYKGTISKYYDRKIDLGYILYDDIYELKGAMIFVSKKLYKELDEKELVFVKNTMNAKMKKEFSNQFDMEKEYKNLLSNFKESSV